MFLSVRRYVFRALLAVSLVMAGYELIRQWIEYREIREIAERVVFRAGAQDNRSRVIAIRDYLRSEVTHLDAPFLDEDRPFLRATALETLNSGKGYCGEVSRTFINMASAVGIPSQRINLYGKNIHTVAEAELAPGQTVIVDALDTPQIQDLETLEQVMMRPEYLDYYTLNLRRLRITWFIRRIKTEIGVLTYWTENPHLLKATAWLLLGLSLIMFKCGRDTIRYLLQKRGWIHVSTLKYHEQQ